VEELHAAIVAHLRAQRRQLAETGERESAIMARSYQLAGVRRSLRAVLR